MKILIDNGHDIDTKGKRSPDGQLLEYAQNRLLAGRIVSALQARGMDASLLVPEETDIPLPERCRRVNEWCRQLGKDNILFISIHCNAAGRGNTRADALATSLYTAARVHLPGHRLRTDYTDPRPGSRLLPPPPHLLTCRSESLKALVKNESAVARLYTIDQKNHDPNVILRKARGMVNRRFVRAIVVEGININPLSIQEWIDRFKYWRTTHEVIIGVCDDDLEATSNG